MNSFMNPTSLKADPAEARFDRDGNASLLGYMTMNPGVARMGWFGNDGMESTKSLAVQNPTMNFSGQGVPASRVDDQSRLEFQFGETHRTRAKQQVFPRSFATTPYFGTGSASTQIDKDTELKYNGYLRQPKTVATISDKSTYWPIAPLLPGVKADLSTTSNFIEPDAAHDWVRGGADTRQGAHKVVARAQHAHI